MDASLTQQEEEQIREAIESYGESAQAQLEGGPKELFCQHWPTAKEVLDFLRGILPPPAPAAIGVVIRIGDWAHANTRICPR